MIAPTWRFGRHLGPLWGGLGDSWAGLGRSWAALWLLSGLDFAMLQGPVPQDPLALPTNVVLLEPKALPTSVALLGPTANTGACECNCGILFVLANSQILSTTRYSQTLTVAS